jgi:hypothetical protein
MKQSVHACFGHILFCNDYNDGEHVKVLIYTTSNNTMFAVQGFETRDGVKSHEAGDLVKSNKEIPAGTYAAVMRDNYRVWCYSPFWNKGQDPELEKLIVDAGEEKTLLSGTKLFLCAGTLKVGNSDITGPAQIRIKNDEAVIAVDQCYGLLFP